MSFEVRKQFGPSPANFPPRTEWAIYRGSRVSGFRSQVTGAPVEFVAYARSWTVAQRAVPEIEASLARLEARLGALPLTQEAIDTRPASERPMGIIRQLLWNAGRSQ